MTDRTPEPAFLSNWRVQMYFPSLRGWVEATRHRERADADKRADEIRLAGYQARVLRIEE